MFEYRDIHVKGWGDDARNRNNDCIVGTRNKEPYFSLNKDKKTRLTYMGKRKEALAMEYSKNYRKLLELIEKMTILNTELLRKL